MNAFLTIAALLILWQVQSVYSEGFVFLLRQEIRPCRRLLEKGGMTMREAREGFWDGPVGG